MIKFLKYLGIVLLVIVALLFLFRNKILSTAVNSYVQTLNKSEHVPFNINYYDFNIDPLYGVLELYDLKLVPKKKAVNDNLNIDFSAKSIKVLGINTKEIYFKIVDTESIELVEPKLIYYLNVDEEGKAIKSSNAEPQDTARKKNSTPWLGFLDNLKIGELAFVDGLIRVFKVHQDTTLFVELLGYNIRAHSSDEDLFDFSKENYVAFDSLTFDLGKEFLLQTSTVKLDLNTNDLKLKKVYLNNKFEEMAFLNGLKYKKDWMDIFIDEIDLINMDIASLSSTYFHSDSVLINGVDMQVSEPGTLVKEPGFEGKMMNDWFMSIPEMIKLDYIQISNANINFKMYDAPYEGKLDIPITIEKANVDILEDEFDLMANAHIYSSPVILKVKGQANNSYKTSVSASVLDLKADWLNKISIPMAGVKIDNIENSRIDFYYSYSGKNVYTNGQMDFKYKSLKLDVFKRNESKKDRKNDILSFAANVALKKQNHPDHKHYVKAPISYRKEKFQGFFAHMVKCIMEGAEYAIIKKK